MFISSELTYLLIPEFVEYPESNTWREIPENNVTKCSLIQLPLILTTSPRISSLLEPFGRTIQKQFIRLNNYSASTCILND